MEGPIGFGDWESLHSPAAAAVSAPPPGDVESLLDHTGATVPDDAIRSDYFALDSHHLRAERPLRLDGQEVPSDCYSPGWVDPPELKRKPAAAADEFWTSDESSDELSPRGSGVGRSESSESAPGLLESREGALAGEPNGNNRGSATAERGKGGMVWWKLPVELLKSCVAKVRPVWPLPVAAALLGLFLLGRSFYRMRRKGQGPPLRLNIHDKKVSLFALRATHLNDVYSAGKRLPIMRSPLPSAGMTPWPVLALR